MVINNRLYVVKVIICALKLNVNTLCTIIVSLINNLNDVLNLILDSDLFCILRVGERR